MHCKSKKLLLLCLVCGHLYGQNTDSLKAKTLLTGNAGITNNGISLIPTFSLEKPAALFNMSAAKSKFSFDPEITFSLQDGKPWYLLLWLRYKVLDEGRFKFTAGTHLGLNFRRSVLEVNNTYAKVLFTDRYVVAEFSPTYSLSKNLSLSAYSLLSHGLDPGTPNFTQFFTLGLSFSDIKLSEKFYLKAFPQAYYLKMDSKDGIYFTSSFTLGKYKFPLTVSSVINKVMDTQINTGKTFVWNVTLNYSFN
jgi:hypothetical protein